MKKTYRSIAHLTLLLKSSIINKISRKKRKEARAKKEYLLLKNLIQSNSFVFEAEKVNPMGGAYIDVKGEGDFLEIKRDSVNTFLPYFGVLHNSSGFNGSGAIKINNIIENYKVQYNDTKRKICVKLKGYKNMEAFEIILDIYKSGAASLSIYGSNRSHINYYGIIHS